jgi:predicted Zn-ribbon and HTH transcriptional regulator
VKERQPRERGSTLRQALLEALRGPPATARDLSQLVRISERDVLDHLEHLAESLKSELVVEPAECKACGFQFEGRTRMRKPSRCPECKSERIAPPRFCVASET